MSTTTEPAAPALAALEQPSVHAVIDGGMAAVLQSIVDVEGLIASLTAYRAVAIDEVHRLAVAAEGPFLADSARPWSHEVAARRVAASEVAAALRVSEREAENLVADSGALVHQLPSTLAALKAGRVSYRHASILVDEARSLPRESWPSFEVAVLPEAETRTPAGFRQRARTAREREHPDSIDERRHAAENSRTVRLAPSRDGMAWLEAHLPAEQAIGAYRRLNEIATSLGGRHEPRTLAQRRADVFSDLLIDGILPDTGLGRGVRATVLVTVPALTLLATPGSASASASAAAVAVAVAVAGAGSGAGAGAQAGAGAGAQAGAGAAAEAEPTIALPTDHASLEGYGPIAADVARRLAAHAPSFVRLLTHPETGTVLSVGRERYAVPRDLRLWLRIRDETCRFPGCGRSAANSDVDHTVEWQHEGATRHDNLAHLCEAHHRLKHQTDWRVSQAGGGALEWRAPSGRTYRTGPALRLAG